MRNNRNGSGLDTFVGRVDANGTPLSGNGFAIGADVHDQADPVVAFNGNYRVAWRDARDGTSDRDIFASIVTPGGTAGQDFPVVEANDRFEANAGVGRGAGGNWAIIYELRSSTAPNQVVLRGISPK